MSRRIASFGWIVAGIALIAGCRIPVHRVPAATAPTSGSATAVSAPGDDASDRYRDLRLFGQSSASSEFSFEARPTDNLQQHTTPSEGGDFDPSVDPAGRQLVFASTRHSVHSHIYVKPINGATLVQLTDERANDAQPVFCPMGKRIAFASDRAGQWDIYVMDANGRNVRQITNDPAAELHPSWSPDGTRIVYCRLNPSEPEGELWVVDLDNPGAKRFIGEGLFPAWSPRGGKIAYQRARQRGSRWFSIWTMDFDNNESLYPTEVASSTLAAFILPSWSPDGTQIAFAAISPAGDDGSRPRLSGRGRSDILLVDADGRGMQRLTNGRGENYSPYWAADQRVYFTARSGRSETIWSARPFQPATEDVPSPGAPNRRAASAQEVADE